jgi:prepilin-type N-terminal cleavage/methylation domain-containing protein
MSPKYKRGFTLIELLILIALIGIVAAVAVPGFSQLIENNRLTSANNDLVGALSMARSEAVRLGTSVNVVPAGANYSDGIRVQATVNGTTQTLREVAGPDGNVSVTLSSGSNPGFRANGLGTHASTVVFDICASSGEQGSQVSVTRGGQVESTNITCP